jgi:hypothetical protein
VTKKRVEAVTIWAEQVQALSPNPMGLGESVEGIIKSSDLARNTARDLHIPFETEPSAFVKLLNELAPNDDS